MNIQEEKKYFQKENSTSVHRSAILEKMGRVRQL